MVLRLPLDVRARLLWARARDSLWFIPALATLLAALLAAWAVRVEDFEVAPAAFRRELFFIGGAEGARGVLTAIAGSLITVTATVFSVTIVALQLSGSQYTPRVLRSFLADRANQMVLGIFIGTFTYSLLVLRTVHAPAEGMVGFVPAFAVTVAVGLVLVSIGALIFFINHAARSIQLSVILDRETEQTLARIEEAFPEREDDATLPGCAPAESAMGDVVLVRAGKGGYLQAVHVGAVVRVADAHDCTVRMVRRTGEYVIAGEALAEVWPAPALSPQAEATLREAVLLGPERTPEQDPEFGLIEIADIAVRAMSYAINDPTTALLCIDRLGELLVHLGRRRIPAPPVCGRGGVARLILLGTTFDRALGLAFDQLRYYGAENPAVAKKLIDTVARIRNLVAAEHHPALDAHAAAVLRAARHELDNPADFRAVERLAERRARGGDRRLHGFVDHVEVSSLRDEEGAPPDPEVRGTPRAS